MESKARKSQGFYACFFFPPQIETVYNLREENRQLRKAHQDMHTQLQDVKVEQNRALACFTLSINFTSHSLIDLHYKSTLLFWASHKLECAHYFYRVCIVS